MKNARSNGSKYFTKLDIEVDWPWSAFTLIRQSNRSGGRISLTLRYVVTSNSIFFFFFFEIKQEIPILGWAPVMAMILKNIRSTTCIECDPCQGPVWTKCLSGYVV